MVWTVPPTKTPHDPLLSSDLNTYVRDNMLDTVIERRTSGVISKRLIVSTGQNAYDVSDSEVFVISNETVTSTTPFEIAPSVPRIIATSGYAMVHLKVDFDRNQNAVTGAKNTYVGMWQSGDTEAHFEYSVYGTHINSEIWSCAYLIPMDSTPLSFYAWTEDPDDEVKVNRAEAYVTGL